VDSTPAIAATLDLVDDDIRYAVQQLAVTP